MDLLFKRYASPYLLVDQMLSAGQFSDFIFEVNNMERKEQDEETLWQFFLHKVNDKSFVDFKKDLENQSNEMTDDDIETTITESFKMLNKFEPTLQTRG